MLPSATAKMRNLSKDAIGFIFTAIYIYIYMISYMSQDDVILYDVIGMK